MINDNGELPGGAVPGSQASIRDRHHVSQTGGQRARGSRWFGPNGVFGPARTVNRPGVTENYSKFSDTETLVDRKLVGSVELTVPSTATQQPGKHQETLATPTPSSHMHQHTDYQELESPVMANALEIGRAHV